MQYLYNLENISHYDLLCKYNLAYTIFAVYDINQPNKNIFESKIMQFTGDTNEPNKVT